MLPRTKTYDTHVHIGAARHSGRRYSAAELLRDMDRNGVGRALVIPFPVVEDYRAAHDEIGQAVLAHPDRLVGAACLPAFIAAQERRDELTRCIEHYGFRALKIQPQYQPLNPLSAEALSVFELARDLGLVVVVHTGSGAPFALPSLYQAPAAEFPTLPIVLAHCGGPLFYLEAIVAARMCPNILLELSSLAPHQAAEVIAHTDCRRIMVGSDLPESQASEMGKLRDLTLPDESREAILWKNAARIFDGIEG